MKPWPAIEPYRTPVNPLPALVADGDGQGVLAYFSRLTNSRRREASRVLEREAARLDATVFWHLALTLARSDSKAYLGTLLKAAPATIAPDFAAWLLDKGTATDLSKTIEALLPRQATPEAVEHLFACLEVFAPQDRADYLLRNLTWPAAYILFQSMRKMESERGWLLSLCRRLIKDGTAIGWTLASLARTYFDLPELRGTFSLKLEPYQLSRIENSYDAFCRL